MTDPTEDRRERIEYEPYPGAWGRFPEYIETCHAEIDRLTARVKELEAMGPTAGRPLPAPPGAAPAEDRVGAGVPDVDTLAQVIRRVDGSNSLGAGALAEAILAALSHPRRPAPEPSQGDVEAVRRAALDALLPRGVEWHMVRAALTGMSKCEGLTTFQQINARIAAGVVAALAHPTPEAGERQGTESGTGGEPPDNAEAQAARVLAMLDLSPETARAEYRAMLDRLNRPEPQRSTPEESRDDD